MAALRDAKTWDIYSSHWNHCKKVARPIMAGPLTNPRHEAFCRAIVAQIGGKYTSQGAAYVAAGYQAKDAGKRGGSAEVCAARLLNRVQPIATRIGELQAQAAKRKKITVESIVEELDEARTLARDKEHTNTMVAASTAKAKILGLVVDRTEQGKPGDFTQSDSQANVARMLLKNAGMEESEIESEYGKLACAEAITALAHFNDRISAIVAGRAQPRTIS